MSDRKINFKVNLPLELVGATVAIAVTTSRMFLPKLFDTYLNYILAKIEQSRKVQKWFKNNFDKALTPFCKTF